MNRDFVVTIGGPHGSGRSTIAKAIQKRFGLSRFSTGKVFRSVAKTRRLSVLDLDESAEKEVDLEVDRQSREAALKGSVVIESDLAAWVNKDTLGKTVIKIWLAASPETRGGRIFGDEKKRLSEKYASIEDAIIAVKRRDSADKKRYKACYQIDLDDMSIYDLVINTENLTIEQVINNVAEYLKQRGCKEDDRHRESMHKERRQGLR